MRRRSQYLERLRPLLTSPIFSNRDAEKLNVPRQALLYLSKIGLLEKLGRGIYRFSDYEPEVDIAWESLAETVSSVPGGVVCLISALSYYELTEEIPRQHWIAIPNKRKAPIRKNTKILRMRNITLGRTSVQIGEYYIPIFDKERCIIDAFRYLGKEIAIKALKEYLHNPKHQTSMKKLAAYARELRVDIYPYILAFTT